MQDRSGFQTHGGGNAATCLEGWIAATDNQNRDEFNRMMNLEPVNRINVVP